MLKLENIVYLELEVLDYPYIKQTQISSTFTIVVKIVGINLVEWALASRSYYKNGLLYNYNNNGPENASSLWVVIKSPSHNQ
jgi:hypothetical protein